MAITLSLETYSSEGLVDTLVKTHSHSLYLQVALRICDIMYCLMMAVSNGSQWEDITPLPR